MSILKVCSITVSIICLFTPLPAKAENWVRLNTSFSVDSDSVSADRNFRRYWVRFDGESGVMISDEIANCSNRSKSTMEQLFYDSSYNFISKKSFEYGEKVRSVTPDTVGEMTLDFVCKK